LNPALEKAAKRSNLPKEEIEEMSVPNYGLAGSWKIERKNW
jgi:hypothetical protein